MPSDPIRSRRIPEDLVDFFEAGTSMLVGTCDDALRPEHTRAVGAAVAKDRERLTVFLNEATSVLTLANLKVNPAIAVCFCRPADYRTVQVKGRALSMRPATEAERPFVDRYVFALTEALYLVGMTRAVTSRLGHWPSVAVEVSIDEMFQQSPGPGAGRRLET